MRQVSMDRMVISTPDAGYRGTARMLSAISEAANNTVASSESIFYGDVCVGEGIEPVVYELNHARTTGLYEWVMVHVVLRNQFGELVSVMAIHDVGEQVGGGNHIVEIVTQNENRAKPTAGSRNTRSSTHRPQPRCRRALTESKC
jgi:hypothetical protein